MKHFFMMAAVLLLADFLCSCTKDNSATSCDSIQFSLTTEDQLSTKATLHNDAGTVSTIGFCGTAGTSVITSDTATKSDALWVSAGTYALKSSDAVALYAYYPSSLSPTAGTGNISVTHSPAATASSQKDLMLGYSTTRDTGTKAVTMSLNHALTSVSFLYGDVPSTGLSITSIVISNVYSSAKCTFATDGSFTWSDQSDKDGSFTGSTTVEPEEDENLGTDATFTLIPQSFDTESDRAVITINYTLNSSAKSTTFKPALLGSWERGKTYRYKINCSEFNLTVEAVNFNGGTWSTHDADDVDANRFGGENW